MRGSPWEEFLLSDPSALEDLTTGSPFWILDSIDHPCIVYHQLRKLESFRHVLQLILRGDYLHVPQLLGQDQT
jgi:hypothetical protein